MNLFELLQSTGVVGQSAAIAGIVALVISVSLAVLLGWRRVAPGFVIAPLAAVAAVGNGAAAFRVWGLREALFDAPNTERIAELEVALNEAAAAMGAGAVVAAGGSLVVLAILAVDDLTSKDGSPRWTPGHAAAALIGGGSAAGVAAAAGTELLAFALLIAGILAAVAASKQPTEAARPRADAWRATSVLSTGLVGVGVSCWLFCEAVLVVHSQYTGTVGAVSDEAFASALDALSWRVVVAPVVVSLIGALVAWGLSRPPRKGVFGLVLGALLVTGTGASALVATREMSNTLKALETDFDADGRHRVERRLHIELPRVADGDVHTPGLDVFIGKRGVEIAGVPVVTIRTRPTGRGFPTTQIDDDILPAVSEAMQRLRSGSALADVHATGRGRITLWADASEQWTVVHTVLASLVVSGPLDVDVAAIVSESHVTSVPLRIVAGPPTDGLDRNGGLRQLLDGDEMAVHVDEDVALGTVIATVEDQPDVAVILR